MASLIKADELKRKADEFNQIAEDQFAELERQADLKSKPNFPEQDLDAILLTKNDVDTKQIDNEEGAIELAFSENLNLVQTNQAGGKKDAIQQQQNSDRNDKLEGNVRDTMEAAIAAPDDQYGTAMSAVEFAVGQYQMFNLKGRRGSTSLLDIMSDGTEGDVQRYGSMRGMWNAGYLDLMGYLAGSHITTDRLNAMQFIEAARTIEKKYGEEAAFGPVPEQFTVTGIGGNQFLPEEQASSAARGLIEFGETPLAKLMADHPYYTSFLIDAMITLGPPSAKVIGAGLVTSLGITVARQQLIRRSGRLTVPAIIKALGINKKVYIAQLKKSLIPAGTQIGLGLGFVWVAGEMMKDGSSKTKAVLTEMFGPAGVLVLLHFTKSAGISYFRNLSIKNAAMFKRLEKELLTRNDFFSTEIKATMRQAVKTQNETLGKLTQQIVDETNVLGKPPIANTMSKVRTMDHTLAENITEMVDVGLKKQGPAADHIRKVTGLDGTESLTSQKRLAESVPFQLDVSDVDEVVALLDEIPELGAAFRGVGANIDNSIGLYKQQLKFGNLPKEAQANLRRQIADSEKYQAAFAKAAAQFDLKAFDMHNIAYMQSDIGRLLFSTLPEFQGLSGKILYKEISEEMVGTAVEIQGRTVKLINTNLRTIESNLQEHTFGVNLGVWDIPEKGGIFKHMRQILGKIGESPSAHFGVNSQELVNLVARANEGKRVFAKELVGIWDGIQASVSRKQRPILNGLLAEGNDTAQVFKLVQGGLMDALGNVKYYDDKVMDAYFASRSLMDATWRFVNRGVVTEATAKGFMLMDGKIIVQLRGGTVGFIDSKGTKMTKEMLDQNYKVVNIFDDNKQVAQSIILQPDVISRAIKDIPQDYNMTGYHSGYIPNVYEGDWRVVRIRRVGDSWETNTPVIAQNAKDANTAMATLIEREGVDSGTLFMAIRNNVSPKDIGAQLTGGRIKLKGDTADPLVKQHITSFIKDLDTDSALQKMTDEELDALASSLARQGLGREVGEDLVAEARFFSGPRHTRARALERPRDALNLEQPAPRLDVTESVQTYLGQVAKHSNLGELQAKLQDKFLRTFKDHLENPRDWTSKVEVNKARKFGTVDDQAKAMEAWSTQHQLKVIGGMRTAEQAVIDQQFGVWRDRLIAKGSYRMAAVMDSMADSAGIQGVIRNTTAKAIFGLWNASHFVIQASAVMFTGSKALVHHPEDIPLAMQSTLKYAYGRVAKKMGLPTDAETRFLVDFVDRSGYISNANYVGLDTVTGAGGISSLLDKSTVFARQGEAFQRLFAFNWNLHNSMRMIRAGKHPAGFTADDITSKKFSDYITGKAEITAFNMSAVNQPLYSQGTLGVSFQFAQIQSQMAQLYFGLGSKASTLTRVERMALWMTTAAALGPTAIPFAETTLAFSDWIQAKELKVADVVIKEGNPTGAGLEIAQFHHATVLKMIDWFGDKNDKKSVDYWRRVSTGGLINAETRGAGNIAKRAALNVFTNTYYDNLDPAMVFGPGLNVAASMVAGTISSMYDIGRIITSEDKDLAVTDILRAARKTVGILGGARNILSTIEVLLDGKITTRSGRAIIEGLSLKEIMETAGDARFDKELAVLGVAVGLTGERVERAQRENQIRMRQREAWGDWESAVTRAIRRASYNGDIKTAVEILVAGVKQVGQWRAWETPKFLKAATASMLIDPDATIEDKNMLEGMKFNIDGEEIVPFF